MTDRTTERRSHARFDRMFEIQEIGTEAGAAGRMVARNLSLGGLYCTSTRGFGEMARVAVRLMLPIDGTTESVDVEAVVVRQREVRSSGGRPGYELALFFTRVDDDQRRRLSHYLGK